MTAVSFASAGYVCQAQGSVETTVVCQGELTGTITDTEVLQGTITEDCAAPDYDILTFALAAPAAVEIGTIVNTPGFTATHNRPPTTLTLTNNANAESKNVVLTPNAFTSDLSYQQTAPGSVTWTLTGSDGGPIDTAQASLQWQATLITGWTTNPGPYTEADLLALNEFANPLDADGLFQVSLSPTNGYLIAAYHDTYNGAVPTDFLVGNFIPGGASEVQTAETVTIPNGTAPYTIVRSNLIQTATGLNWQRVS